jgi:hypothetical protein
LFLSFVPLFRSVLYFCLLHLISYTGRPIHLITKCFLECLWLSNCSALCISHSYHAFCMHLPSHRPFNHPNTINCTVQIMNIIYEIWLCYYTETESVLLWNPGTHLPNYTVS